MGVHTNLSQGMDRIIRNAGMPIRIQYFEQTIGSVWDDDISSWGQSGTDLWTSGVIYPIRAREGSDESVLMQQGKLIDGDKTLWANGSLILTGSSLSTTIMVGSPGDLYTTIEDGGQHWQVEGKPVYLKQWIRRLTNGSLLK